MTVTPTVRVTAKSYTRSEQANEERFPDRVVDAEYVRRFTSKESVAFSESIGGTETVKKLSGGVISCVSVSPAGDYTRRVVFTPVRP